MAGQFKSCGKIAGVIARRRKPTKQSILITFLDCFVATKVAPRNDGLVKSTFVIARPHSGRGNPKSDQKWIALLCFAAPSLINRVMLVGLVIMVILPL